MAFTQLDPDTALIIIDLQKGILALETCHPKKPVVNHCTQLIKAFRAKEKPVVLVNVSKSPTGRNETNAKQKAPIALDWSELITELKPEPSDILITKKNWGAFINTDLDQKLRNLNVTQVVIAGIATSIGVESTARQAFELGYNVSLVTDAMTDLNINTHKNSIQLIFPRMSETGTTADLLKLLES